MLIRLMSAVAPNFLDSAPCRSPIIMPMPMPMPAGIVMARRLLSASSAGAIHVENLQIQA